MVTCEASANHMIDMTKEMELTGLFKGYGVPNVLFNGYGVPHNIYININK